MAEIVSIIGITHNPFMPRLFKQPQQPPGTAKIKERIAMMRQKLADAKPDVLICIGNDHLHQFFMDNMPAFMIGKMDQYDGTFYDEEREFGLPKCKLPGDVDVSDAIMEGAFDRDVDFSYSNELTIDHSIIVPMLFVSPEMDIPVVPILTNCIAPPLPRAKRYFEVGKAIRGDIDNLPTNGFADFEITLGSRHRRRDAVGQDRHDGNIHFRADEKHRNDNRVIDSELIGIGEVDAAIEGAFHDRVGDVDVAGQLAFRQAELPFLVIKRPVVLIHLADHERRHVVHEKLMQVIFAYAADHVRFPF